MDVSHLTVLLLALAMSLTVSQGQKVNVSVYYEVLCPDSIRFVRGSMWRAYKLVPDIMNLELVPYGKAHYERRSDDSISFSCQHGPDECAGNMVQACALNLLPQDKQVDFVRCMLTSRRPQSSGPSCAASLSLSYADVESCVSGSAGPKFLMEMGQKTEALRPKLSFVPWIVVDGEYKDETQDAALDDLKSVVCAAYRGADKPAKCS